MRMTPILLCIVLLAGVVFAESILAQPFTMRVVDEFGHGISHVRVVTDNSIVCYSLLDGTLRWSESSVMRRSVQFSIHDYAHRFEGTVATMHVKRGSVAVVTLERNVSAAEIRAPAGCIPDGTSCAVPSSSNTTIRSMIKTWLS